ncbi:cAMP-responsive element modulator [Pimephales promelas]|nr:cAMP-responsive element modulator [Pimephales promelas]
MDAADGSKKISPSAEDAQASSVIFKDENPDGDLPDSSTSTDLSDGLKVSVNQSGSVQLIPCHQRYETFTSWPRSPIMQYAVHSSNGTYLVSEKKGQATPGGMSAYQVSSPVSGLSQVNDSSSGSLPSPQQLAEDVSRKREHRLMKNREAARECRRKKKEYVKCLENRVAVLEKQNKMLIEELKALKDLYCHKTE